MARGRSTRPSPTGVGAMTALVTATVGHGATAFWYLTRATGLVALIVLSATLVLGIVSSVGWTTERWPRFLSQSVHRNLSIFSLAFVVVHVVTTVADGYVPIRSEEHTSELQSLRHLVCR